MQSNDISKRDVIAGAMVAAIATVAAKIPHQVKKQIAAKQSRNLDQEWYFAEMLRIMKVVFRVEIQPGTKEYEFAYEIAKLNVGAYNQQQDLMYAMTLDR